jgi:hypothetical protein
MAVLANSAVADDWMEYSYPELGFSVSFPAAPASETMPYRTVEGAMANETQYSVQQENSAYRVSIIDFGNVTFDRDAAIEEALNEFRGKGDVKVDIPARVNRNFGRQLSIVAKDGSRSSVAVFFANNRIYEIEGTILASNPDPNSGDAIRFQQSLRFTGNNAAPPFGGRGRFGRGGRRPFPPPPPGNGGI